MCRLLPLLRYYDVDATAAVGVQGKISLRTLRSPFRFSWRPRQAVSDAEAPPVLHMTAHSFSSPMPQVPFTPLSTAALAANSHPLPPPLGTTQGGAGVADREEGEVDGSEKVRVSEGAEGAPPRAAPAPPLRARLLSRATTYRPHPNGTVHVRKAGRPHCSASRIGRMCSTSTTASAAYAVLGPRPDWPTRTKRL